MTGDVDLRLELYAQAQTMIAADQPSMWMYTENTVLGVNDCIKGYVYRPLESLSVLFQDVWMENCPA